MANTVSAQKGAPTGGHTPLRCRFGGRRDRRYKNQLTDHETRTTSPLGP